MVTFWQFWRKFWLLIPLWLASGGGLIACVIGGQGSDGWALAGWLLGFLLAGACTIVLSVGVVGCSFSSHFRQTFWDDVESDSKPTGSREHIEVIGCCAQRVFADPPPLVYDPLSGQRSILS